jgi:hypothetical protein
MATTAANGISTPKPLTLHPLDHRNIVKADGHAVNAHCTQSGPFPPAMPPSQAEIWLLRRQDCIQ